MDVLAVEFDPAAMVGGRQRPGLRTLAGTGASTWSRRAATLGADSSSVTDAPLLGRSLLPPLGCGFAELRTGYVELRPGGACHTCTVRLRPMDVA